MRCSIASVLPGERVLPRAESIAFTPRFARLVRRCLPALAALAAALPAAAHVTPNVELLKKADFVRQALPGAAKFFEQKLHLSAGDQAALEKTTGWTPSEEDTRIYIGRDEQGRKVGSVVLLWMPSEHGPVGVGVAFDPEGTVRHVAVTDVGSEPLGWVRPLLERGGMESFAGLPAEGMPDPAKVAPEITDTMGRYYAKVIAGAVARCQAVARVSLAAAR